MSYLEHFEPYLCEMHSFLCELDLLYCLLYTTTKNDIPFSVKHLFINAVYYAMLYLTLYICKLVNYIQRCGCHNELQQNNPQMSIFQFSTSVYSEPFQQDLSLTIYGPSYQVSACLSSNCRQKIKQRIVHFLLWCLVLPF